MSPLPQRKKSAEELAKLRESLGIPDTAPPPPDLANPLPPAPPPPARTWSPPAEPTPEPEAPKPPPPSAPSAPVLSPDQQSPQAPRPPQPAAEPVSLPLRKPVRSLRKSERLPLEPRRSTAPKSGSVIPVRRQTPEELNEIRRREAIAAQGKPPLFAPLLAHPALLAAGYAAALAGGFFALRDYHYGWMAGFEAIALIIAGFVFFKKSLSRHHAGFIGVLALFIAIFAALHYFPQLQNAP